MGRRVRGVARMEYDLIRLFEHPLYMLDLIPAAIVTFGEGGVDRRVIEVQWRPSAGEPLVEADLTLSWDLDVRRVSFSMIERQLTSYRQRDHDQATRTEMAAIAVAAAVLAHIEPDNRFTGRSDTGSGHDYYLNETTDEMIEVAGEWTGGLPRLFRKKTKQSGTNSGLRKRWVSTTIMRVTPRNRTEGLHP